MPEFKDLPGDFCCPHRDGCPYLEGLPTRWVFHRYQEVVGTECHYECLVSKIYGLIPAPEAGLTCDTGLFP